jgi:hypothetical protein
VRPTAAINQGYIEVPKLVNEQNQANPGAELVADPVVKAVMGKK